MQAGVARKVLDDAELIASVRQTQDQFEARGELKAVSGKTGAAGGGCSGREGRSTTIASIIHWKAHFE
jgi:hypothetical protein